jgi:hypothetical protein
MAPGTISEHILQVWERGHGRPAAQRATQVLEIMPPGVGLAETAALFERDAALTALRIRLVGAHLDAVVRCPECMTEFDVPIDLSELAIDARQAAPVSVQVEGFAARVRPPAVHDLAALSYRLPPDAFAAALFFRCVEHATHDGVEVPASELPEAIRSAAAAALSERGLEGPFADLACGECGHAWLAPLDIASVLLRDIDAWALRQLDEVHRIASAYHWSEGDILALSPSRRRFYLEAIG